MSSHYSFPLLTVAEISATLAELDIKMEQADLCDPAGWKVRQIYEALIALLLNQTKEDRAQPVFLEDDIEYPELHDESIPMLAFMKSCHKLLSTSGVSDFKLDDIQKPEPKRLRRNLSAIINFARFHEDRHAGFTEITSKTDALAEEKARLTDENERLATIVAEANAARQHEAAEVAELTEDNAKRDVVVRTLFNQQTEVHNEIKALKAELKAVEDRVREATFALQEAETERDALKEQVVPDPRKLKNDLAALREAEVSEKAAVRALELKVAQQTKQREALETAEHEVDEALAVQAEVEVEQSKLKEVQRSIKDNEESFSRDDAERNDVLHQIKVQNQRNTLAMERCDRLTEQHVPKQKVALDALGEAQRAWAAVEAERGAHSRQLEGNDSLVRDLRDKLLRGKMEHEAEVASVQQQQQQLAAQVRAYHADLTSEMKKVSAANAVLVA